MPDAPAGGTDTTAGSITRNWGGDLASLLRAAFAALGTRQFWRSAWGVVKQISGAIETLAKPTALVLAILGLLAFYVPGVRRFWEERTLPTASFQVGTIERRADGGAIILVPNDYDSPAWNGGLHADRLFDLPGKDVLTTGTAVGRANADLYSQVMTVLEKDKCLHVQGVRFQPFVQGAWLGNDYPLSDLQGATPQARLDDLMRRAAAGHPGRCQIATESERRTIEGRTEGKTATSAPAFVPGLAVCPRTLIWIEAQKVSC